MTKKRPCSETKPADNKITILPQQKTLPPGTPYFDIVPKKDLHSLLSSYISPEAVGSKAVTPMLMFVLAHGLHDWICVDENNCILGGFEYLEKAESEMVHVMRIPDLKDFWKIAFIIAHAAIYEKCKSDASKKSKKRGKK